MLQIAKIKAYAYGISNDACEVMCSYLSDRFQRFKITNERIPWVALLKRIPQGSGLGSFLFNTFKNDKFHFVEMCDLIKQSNWS